MCTVINLYTFFLQKYAKYASVLLIMCRGNCIQRHNDGDDNLSATLSIHFMFITVMLGAEIQTVHLCMSNCSPVLCRLQTWSTRPA